MFAPEKAPAARDAGSGFFVFDTQAEADAYIEECDKAIGYPMPGVPAQPYPKGGRSLRRAARDRGALVRAGAPERARRGARSSRPA